MTDDIRDPEPDDDPPDDDEGSDVLPSEPD